MSMHQSSNLQLEDRLPKTELGQLALVVSLMLGVALVDYLSGNLLRVYPLYFIPIALAALTLGRLGAILIAVNCAVIWLAANLIHDQEFSANWIWLWNTAIQGAAFTFIAELVFRLHAARNREGQLARLDKLTGLINSRAFMEQAPMLLDFCRREGKPVTIAYIDLDGFKQVNDTKGHQQGDEVLRTCADEMRSTLRASDLACRIGGDEFAVMLPNTSERGAVEILEKLSASIESSMRLMDCTVTASIGAAVYGVPPPGIDEAIQAADEVMYAVKNSGKNQVRVRYLG